MKKSKVLLVVIMLVVLASATAMAAEGEKNKKGIIENQAGTLFLFQKCDALLAEQDPEAYDALDVPPLKAHGPILPPNDGDR